MPVTINGNKIRVSTAEGKAARDDRRDAKAGAALDGLTYPQAEAWIETNVTSLATAKTALKQLTKLVFMLQADQTRLKARVNRLSRKETP